MPNTTISFPAVGSLGRLSATMCVIVAVGGALAEVLLAWVWLSPAWVEQFVVPRLALGNAPVALDFSTRLAGFSICMISMAALLFALHQAYRVFDAYRLGNMFSADAPVRLRRIGMSLIALAVLRPLTATLLGLVFTIGNPPGQRIVAIGFSIDDYMIATFGGLILAIGHVMVEAKRIADENDQII